MLNQFCKFLLSSFFALLFPLTAFSNHNILLDSAYDLRLNQLYHEIELVLKDHDGLRAGIALVREGQPDWIVTIGSNIEDEKKVNSIFRTASLSKVFVALAILKLQENGKLSLDDKIGDIIPEIEFENPWEETDPIRIVHLLEHTAGWDEIHLVERTHNLIPAIALKKALELHPHSRKSRWVPGSRMSYTNSGYAVAAYIIEKVSGQLFEEYVDFSILKPLKMNHTTYFNDSLYQRWGANTFNWAMEIVNYKNELYRPSAALNSSPKDLAQVLKLLLNRGVIDTLKHFEVESIIRMEISQSTPSALEGLELGYGLGNFTTNYNGFTYYGHDGAMDGGLSQLAYLPEHGIGHVLLLNSNNALVMQRLANLIRDFETEKLPSPKQKIAKYEGEVNLLEGYYLAINPRNQNLFYQDVLFAGIEKIEVHNNIVSRSWLFPGASSKYHAISATQFILDGTSKIGLVVAQDPLDGKVLYSENSVLKPISTLRVYFQLSLLGLWIALIFIGLVSFFMLFIFFIFNSKKYQSITRISLFPTITSILILLIFFLKYFGFEEQQFSAPSFISISLLCCSILFVVGALASVIALYNSRKYQVKKIFRYPLIALSGLHLVASIYLIFYGFIPIITWI
jgi:CubicO group peptidase (beta-lactamase class C family)